MPVTDYSQGKIYKVGVIGEEYCYIGSTTNTLTERMYNHKTNAKYERQKKTACCVLFEDGKIPYIELLESYPCESKLELEKRERYWLEQTLHAVNKNVPTQTWQERWEKNRELNLQKHREWLQAHKEEQSQKQKEKRLALSEEDRKAKDKAEYDKRKETALAKKKEKVRCPVCDKEMNRNSLWTHKKYMIFYKWQTRALKQVNEASQMQAIRWSVMTGH